MATTSPEVMTARLRNRRRTYLSNAKQGGYKAEFVHTILREHDADAALYGDDLRAIIGACAASIWDAGEPPWSDNNADDLFTINGIKVQREYTVPDKSVPGGHRKFDHTNATIAHAQADVNLKFRKSAETAAAALDAQRLVDAAITRSGGDLTALLVDQADKVKAKKPEPETV